MKNCFLFQEILISKSQRGKAPPKRRLAGATKNHKQNNLMTILFCHIIILNIYFCFLCMDFTVKTPYINVM